MTVIKISECIIQEVKLSEDIGRDTQRISSTFFKDLLVTFPDGTVIRSQVNLLPLFWKDQQFFLPREIEISFSDIDLTKKLFNTCDIQGIPNNYLFALESALLTFFQKLNILKLGHDYFTTPTALTSTLELNSNNTKCTSNIRKIKIGINEPTVENENIKELSKNSKLRLDGNQSLSPKTLEQILENIDPEKIEYIEEPFKDIYEWRNFNRGLEFNLAFDESILAHNFDELIKFARYFVIKPSYNFSISQIYKYLNSDIKFVLSSSYEPEISFNVLIHLAKLLESNSNYLIHGLGTTKYMSQDSKFLQKTDNKNLLQGFSFFQNIL